jgi:fluoroacetyl-CoA thioesterase
VTPFATNEIATLEITVTDAMTVDFAELGKLHPVYATYWMAKHFEEASRKLVLPHLEPEEEGIGSAVNVQHTASALVGMRVTITANFQSLEGRKVVCALRAINQLGDQIGYGSTEQFVLPRERIESGFASLEQRWLAHQREST